jgi:hypothetical protein
MTKARKDARAECRGRATVFQVYGGVGHVTQCLIVVLLMLASCHVQQKIGIGQNRFFPLRTGMSGIPFGFPKPP